MIPVDSLGIQIEAEAKPAAASLDNLIGKIDRLNASLTRVSGTGMTSLATGANRLVSAMDRMKSINAADFTRLAKNMSKISAIDNGKIRGVAVSFSGLTKSLNGLAGTTVSDNAAKIGSLAKGIAQLGYKSSTKAITNIPLLANAMEDLIRRMSKLPAVSQNLIDFTNALAKLSKTGASAGSAANSLSKSINTYSSSTKKGTKSTFNLASAIGKIYATYWMLFRAFNSLKSAIDISSNLTEVQNVVDVTFGKYSDLVEKMSETSITDFGMSELSVKKFSSRFQAVGTAMGITQKQVADSSEFLSRKGVSAYGDLGDSMANVSVNLTKLAADMASFYNVEQSAVAEDLESIFTGQTRPLRQYGLDLTEATLREWALKNGLDANIKSMTQAEKTMLRYQYVMANTGAAHGDFTRTVKTWANQVRILKQNFEQLGSVVGGTLINMLKPLVSALNTVIAKFTEFATAVSNSLGKIFGWTYESSTGGGLVQDYEDAAGASDDLASGTGKAADNAKKLRTYLLGIDELNVLEADKGDSSGSGGSGGGASSGLGGAVDEATGGQWVKTESLFEQYESELDSLNKLGDYIGTKISSVLNSINWDSVYQGAINFGTGLADFLNGLISPGLFGSVGRTLANSLNTAIYAALSLGEGFDFYEFGVSIGTGVNNIFKNFDFLSVANTIDIWVQGIWETLTSAISTIEWGTIYNKIVDFLEEIDSKTISIVIGAIAIKKIGSVIFGAELLKSIGTLIGGKISVAIGQGIASTLGLSIASNGGVLAALMAAGASIGNTLWAGIQAVLGGEAAVSALAFINPVIKGLSGIFSVASGAFIAISNFISMLNEGFSWIKETLMVLGVALTAVGAVILGAPAAVAAGIAAAVAALGTVVVVVKDNWDSILKFTQNLWSKISSVFSVVANWFSQNVITPVVGFFKGLWETVSGFFVSLWEDIKEVWNTVSGWFDENVIQPVVKFFVGFSTRVQQIFEGLWIIIQAVWITVSSWFNNNVIIPVVDFFKGLWEKVSGFFSELWEDIKKVWNKVSGWFNTNVIVPVINFFKNIWTDVSGFFSGLWEDVKAIWGTVSTWFNNTVIDPVKNAFEKAVGAISGFFTSLWSGIKKGVISAMNSVIGGIESGINFIVDGINKIIGGFNKIVSWAAKVAETDWGGVDLVQRVSLKRIQGYEFGGFPEPASLFYAGENGVPELLGTVGGRTAVAGGAEITGIREAVYSTGQTEASLLVTAIGLLREIADKDMNVNIGDREIAKASNRGNAMLGRQLITV